MKTYLELLKEQNSKTIRLGPHTFKVSLRRSYDDISDAKKRSAIKQLIKSYPGYLKSAISYIQNQKGPEGFKPKYPASLPLKVEGFKNLKGDSIIVFFGYNENPRFEIQWKLIPPVKITEYNYKHEIVKVRRSNYILKAENGDYYF